MVELEQDGPPSSGEAFDNPALPERVVAVHRPGHHVGEQLQQVVFGTTAGQGESTNVMVEVEVGIGDPRGEREVQRRRVQFLSGPRDRVEAGQQGSLHVGLIRRRSAENRRGADDDRCMRIGVLDLQERRIQRVQVVHSVRLSLVGTWVELGSGRPIEDFVHVETRCHRCRFAVFGCRSDPDENLRVLSRRPNDVANDAAAFRGLGEVGERAGGVAGDRRFEQDP